MLTDVASVVLAIPRRAEQFGISANIEERLQGLGAADIRNAPGATRARVFAYLALTPSRGRLLAPASDCHCCHD
ncbi:MAG: hypothetical protein OEP48_15295, partial [Betaproteobacteria bacterium]|nr:hypothetical protein [Betaproteobacteria bacterium]